MSFCLFSWYSVKSTPESPVTLHRGTNLIMFTTKDKEGFQASCAKMVEVQGTDNVYNIDIYLLYQRVAGNVYWIHRTIELTCLAGNGFGLTSSYCHATSCDYFSVH